MKNKDIIKSDLNLTPELLEFLQKLYKNFNESENNNKQPKQEFSDTIADQQSVWFHNQLVTADQMNVFSQDLYQRIMGMTSNGKSGILYLKSDIGIYSQNSAIIPDGMFKFPNTTYPFLPYNTAIMGYAKEKRFNNLTNGFVVARYTVTPQEPDSNNYSFPTEYVYTDTVNPITDVVILTITNNTLGYDSITKTNWFINHATDNIDSLTRDSGSEHYTSAISPYLLKLFTDNGKHGNFNKLLEYLYGYDDTIVKVYTFTDQNPPPTFLEKGTYAISFSFIASAGNKASDPTLDSHQDWIISGITKLAYLDKNKQYFKNLLGVLGDDYTIIQENGKIYFIDKNSAQQKTIINPNDIQTALIKFVNTIINDRELTYKDPTTSAIQAFYSSDGSNAPLFKDINMQYKIGYRQIIYDENPRAVLYYLSGGLVIFSGQVVTNSDGLFSFNIPQLKTLTNLGGANQVPVYCSILQDSSSPNHNQFAVAELSTNNTTITGKAFYMDTGVGTSAYIAILVIGILANYVGDELAKIRAYKSSFYYDDLPEDKKVELRQYYISLDEAKDLTKVTAPKWLEAELKDKTLN
jgi:hypothetical protein